MSCPREGQQAGNMRGAQTSKEQLLSWYNTAYPLNGSSINGQHTAAPRSHPGNRSITVYGISHTPKVISSCSEGSQSGSCLYHCLCYSVVLPSWYPPLALSTQDKHMQCLVCPCLSPSTSHSTEWQSVSLYIIQTNDCDLQQSKIYCFLSL